MFIDRLNAVFVALPFVSQLNLVLWVVKGLRAQLETYQVRLFQKGGYRRLQETTDPRVVIQGNTVGEYVLSLFVFSLWLFELILFGFLTYYVHNDAIERRAGDAPQQAPAAPAAQAPVDAEAPNQVGV